METCVWCVCVLFLKGLFEFSCVYVVQQRNTGFLGIKQLEYRLIKAKDDVDLGEETVPLSINVTSAVQ